MSRTTLSKVVNGKARVTPEIAVRLSAALAGSTENWLGHQATCDCGRSNSMAITLESLERLASAVGWQLRIDLA